jgi:hypothetical protein
MIKFTTQGHKYYNKDTKYISVTTLLHDFIPPFEEELWSKYKAMERIIDPAIFTDIKRTFGARNVPGLLEDNFHELLDDILAEQVIIKEEWRVTNKEATDRGSKFHDEREAASYERGHELNPFDNQDYTTYIKEEILGGNQQLIEDLYELPDGYYPELLLFNEKYKIAGQADKVYITTKADVRFIDIGDYKTNAKIDITNRFQRMKKGLGHLDDCNYNHYRMQISFYAWMLEQFGFSVRNLSFDHLDHDGKETHYTFDYLNKEVQSVLASR